MSFFTADKVGGKIVYKLHITVSEFYSVPEAHHQFWQIVFLLPVQLQHCFPHRLATD